jgi:hypothetical protein
MSRADRTTNECGHGRALLLHPPFIHTSTLLKAKPDPTFRAIRAAFLPWARLTSVRGNWGHAMPGNAHAPMMSRPLVSTIATVDRADAPKSNQEGEEKSGLSY